MALHEPRQTIARRKGIVDTEQLPGPHLVLNTSAARLPPSRADGRADGQTSLAAWFHSLAVVKRF